MRTEGCLIFQKPNSIRWEVTKPFRSVLVCTDSGAAQFEQIEGNWKRLDLSYMKSIPNFVNGMALFLEGRYRRPTGRLRVLRSAGERNGSRAQAEATGGGKIHRVV